MSEATQIIDQSGVPRLLGTLLPVPGFVSSLPVFSEKVDLLSEAQIVEMARSGLVDGRKKFDESWIKDQRSHGSCNGFAGADALAKARVKRGLQRVDLSGAYLYSLINWGRDGGSLLDDGMRVMQTNGVATADTVKWNQIYPSQYDKAKADAEAAKHKGFECYQARSRGELLTGLALGFTGVVAVHAGNNFMRVDPNTMIAGADSGPGNHAVSVDGLAFDGGGLVATGVNSWNLSYGVKGRMNLVWERHFAQTTQWHPFYLIRSTSDGGDSFPTPTN